MDAKGKAISCSELFDGLKNWGVWHFLLRVKSGIDPDICFIKILSVLRKKKKGSLAQDVESR